MMIKRRFIILGALVALLLVASMASASPAAPGAPTLRWRATANPSVAEIRADGITDGGTAGNGAISWDIYFRLPASVSMPYPTITIVPGPAWTAMSPCSFTTVVAPGQPGVGGVGSNGYYISGFCTATPTTPVTGSDVLIATLTFSGCPATGFLMDMDSGDDAFGDEVTDVVDRFNDPYFPSDAELTDGGACGNPTAVQLANITAGPVAPMTNALCPAMAGVAALLAMAGVAFKGMRKH
ncbi:MAG: hypothetical protein WBV59_22935 [Anaerolineae bacterium]